MTIPSPCKQLCQLDDSGQCCTGCGRTLDEIVRWSSLSDADKQAVRRRLGLDTPVWPALTPKTCTRCGATFSCGSDTGEPCWCAAMPPRPLDPDACDCWCPDCLNT